MVKKSSYGDDVALAPGDLVAASEEIANRLKEFPNIRLHLRRALLLGFSFSLIFKGIDWGGERRGALLFLFRSILKG